MILEAGPSAAPELLYALAAGVEAIVADPTVEVGKQLLEAAGPHLRVVANFGVGIDNVALDECRRRKVTVTNTPDVLTNATAELALGLIWPRPGAQPKPRPTFGRAGRARVQTRASISASSSVAPPSGSSEWAESGNATQSS